ncbi:MAG: acetolactate synthase small subunit [Acidimicrobiia bacterium]
MNQQRPHHVLSVLVENKFGVLTRIAGLFARRGFNIYSLAVSPTDDPCVSRMTIVVDAESTPLEQVSKQLHKLINVLKINEIEAGHGVEQELMMVTVKATPETRSQVTELAAIFDAKIVDVGHDAVTVSASGSPDQLDALMDLLQTFSIVDLQRTGRIALPKLTRKSPKLQAVSTKSA